MKPVYPYQCESCEGKGYWTTEGGGLTMQMPCSYCGETGVVWNTTPHPPRIETERSEVPSASEGSNPSKPSVTKEIPTND